MAVLVLADERRIPLEVANTRTTRRHGLLGRDSVGGGALLITKCRSVHTFGMRFAIDVAHLDSSLCVLRIHMMVPRRLGRIVRRSRQIIEADCGAFALWNVAVGDQLQVER